MKTLRQIRLERNLKQEWIAERVGIPQSRYSKIENGKAKLYAKSARAFCELMNVKFEEIEL